MLVYEVDTVDMDALTEEALGPLNMLAVSMLNRFRAGRSFMGTNCSIFSVLTANDGRNQVKQYDRRSFRLDACR